MADTTAAEAAPQDDDLINRPDLEVGLPGDVKIGGATFRKGVRLTTLIMAARRWHRKAFPEAYTLTSEEKAANLARLQGAPASSAAPAPAEEALTDEDWQAIAVINDKLKEKAAASPVAAPAPTPLTDEVRWALNHAQEWISSAPHGDNCYVSDHYEGDPGNRCNCGKESALASVERGIEALAASPVAAQEGRDARDAARYRWLRSAVNRSGGPVLAMDGGECPGSGELLDAAIDAALGASAKGEQHGL